MFTTTGIGERGVWGDTTCAINSVMRLVNSHSHHNTLLFFSLCTICEFRKPIVSFKIRGFYKSTTMDTDYTLETDDHDEHGVSKPYFKGRMNTNIKWVKAFLAQ